MQVAEIQPGLWRWTAIHPAWTEDDAGPDGWAAEVGCVYWETPDAVVLIDPLVPTETTDGERFWSALDRDVERHARDVVVVLTCSWHRRSTDEIVGRYGGRVAGPTMLPGDAVAYAAADEVVLWLPGPRSLVVGDVLLGDEAGGIRLCPPSWLPEGTVITDVIESLRPVLDMPVERILVSHGEPALADGAAALRRALS